LLNGFTMMIAAAILIMAMLQNIDNCFCSTDFAPQTNPTNVIYLTVVEIAVVGMRASCLPDSLTLGVCCIVLFAMLVKRVLQPYLNSLFQIA